MADRSRKKNQRFLKETSDRSGFDNWSYDGTTFHKRWTGIKQGGLLIEPEEFDAPPPSNKSLGGADISGDPRANWDSTSMLANNVPTVQYVNTASQIQMRDYPFIAITGSNQAVTLASTSPIVAGGSNQVITIMGVGSSVTLSNTNGLVLHAGKAFVMDSGAIITLLYQNTAWNEVSRSHIYKSLGEL